MVRSLAKIRCICEQCKPGGESEPPTSGSRRGCVAFYRTFAKWLFREIGCVYGLTAPWAVSSARMRIFFLICLVPPCQAPRRSVRHPACSAALCTVYYSAPLTGRKQEAPVRGTWYPATDDQERRGGERSLKRSEHPHAALVQCNN